MGIGGTLGSQVQIFDSSCHLGTFTLKLPRSGPRDLLHTKEIKLSPSPQEDRIAGGVLVI